MNDEKTEKYPDISMVDQRWVDHTNGTNVDKRKLKAPERDYGSGDWSGVSLNWISPQPAGRYTKSTGGFGSGNELLLQ